MFDSSEDSTGEADKFQELYEELQTEAGTEEGENVGGDFEEIYENLVVGSTAMEEEEVEVRERGSYLPPEIYQLHMESHNQRMGILTKYVDQEEPAYDIWSGAPDDQAELTGGIDWSTGKEGGWSTVEALQWPRSLRLEDRLDFIPSKQTDVIEGSRDAQPLYQVPRAVRRVEVELSRPGELKLGLTWLRPGTELLIIK